MPVAKTKRAPRFLLYELDGVVLILPEATVAKVAALFLAWEGIDGWTCYILRPLLKPCLSFGLSRPDGIEMRWSQWMTKVPPHLGDRSFGTFSYSSGIQRSFEAYREQCRQRRTVGFSHIGEGRGNMYFF